MDVHGVYKPTYNGGGTGHIEIIQLNMHHVSYV